MLCSISQFRSYSQTKSSQLKFLDENGKEIGVGGTWNRDNRKKMLNSAFIVKNEKTIQYASSFDFHGWSYYQIPVEVPQNTKLIKIDLTEVDIVSAPDLSGNSPYFFIYFVTDKQINTFREFRKMLKGKGPTVYKRWPTGSKHGGNVSSIPSTVLELNPSLSEEYSGKIIFFGYMITDSWKQRSLVCSMINPIITFEIEE